MKVDKSGECWVWTASRFITGYGNFNHHNAHRIAYGLTYGKIPDDVLVLHKCDNPPCVRPDHLYIGTKRDNMRDAIERGQWKRTWSTIGPKNGRSKLNWEKVGIIKTELGLGVSTQELANRFGVSNAAVWFIKIGKHWVE